MSSDNTDGAAEHSAPHDSLAGQARRSNEPIDAAVLAELRSHFDAKESALFCDLLALYINELTPRLRAIRDAIGSADAKAMAAGAHALKGSSLLVGARAMAEMCCEVELAAKGGDRTRLQALLSLMGEEAARVRLALAAICELDTGR